MQTPTQLTRGERNNNPGNIREAPSDKTHWVGERATDDDKSFEEFNTPSDGIRALAVILLTYFRKYKLRTIYDLINKYAPSNENNTAAYIQVVAQQMQLNATALLNLEQYAYLLPLVKAIIFHENGRCIYSDIEIQTAVMRALPTEK